MRQIGILKDEATAKKLVAFLLTEGIKTQADANDDQWEIWIKEEDDLEPGRELFSEFVANPDDEKYAAAITKANLLAKEELERQLKNRDNVIDMRGRWAKPNAQRKPLVTTLMVITVVTFMSTNGWKYASLGNSGEAPQTTFVLKSLLFINPDDAESAVRDFVKKGLETYDQKTEISSESKSEFEDRKNHEAELTKTAMDNIGVKMTNINQGHYWRLFTSIFIHFGLLHIVFNLLWLNALGGQFESVYGTFRFGLFVLTAAVFTTLLQNLMPQEWQGTGAKTMCGGMSGVNYAIAGFVWIKTLFAPGKGLFLSPINMFILIAWMFMGIFDGGKTLAMANWAHGGGFVFGLVIGYLPYLFQNKR